MLYDNFDQLKKTLPKEGRIMALDIGTKTIGVAISDALRLIAFPKMTIVRKSNEYDFLVLKKMIIENKIIALIIGLPLQMDDSESKMSQFVRRFANNFASFLPEIKIAFGDERLSSFAAREVIANELHIKNKKKKKGEIIDQIAASIILETALTNLR